MQVSFTEVHAAEAAWHFASALYAVINLLAQCSMQGMVGPHGNLQGLYSPSAVWYCAFPPHVFSNLLATLSMRGWWDC